MLLMMAGLVGLLSLGTASGVDAATTVLQPTIGVANCDVNNTTPSGGYPGVYVELNACSSFNNTWPSLVGSCTGNNGTTACSLSVGAPGCPQTSPTSFPVSSTQCINLRDFVGSGFATNATVSTVSVDGTQVVRVRLYSQPGCVESSGYTLGVLRQGQCHAVINTDGSNNRVSPIALRLVFSSGATATQSVATLVQFTSLGCWSGAKTLFDRIVVGQCTNTPTGSVLVRPLETAPGSAPSGASRSLHRSFLAAVVAGLVAVAVA